MMVQNYCVEQRGITEAFPHLCNPCHPWFSLWIEPRMARLSGTRVRLRACHDRARRVTCARMSQKAYAAAGVDIDLGNRVKATLPRLLASARRPEMLGQVGGFGGLFALNVKKLRQPVLVA